VNVEWFWIGTRIYRTLIDPVTAIHESLSHKLVLWLTALTALLGNVFQRRTFLYCPANVWAGCRPPHTKLPSQGCLTVEVESLSWCRPHHFQRYSFVFWVLIWYRDKNYALNICIKPYSGCGYQQIMNIGAMSTIWRKMRLRKSRSNFESVACVCISTPHDLFEVRISALSSREFAFLILSNGLRTALSLPFNISPPCSEHEVYMKLPGQSESPLEMGIQNPVNACCRNNITTNTTQYITICCWIISLVLKYIIYFVFVIYKYLRQFYCSSNSTNIYCRIQGLSISSVFTCRCSVTALSLLSHNSESC
jgi:hypothetical protein